MKSITYIVILLSVIFLMPSCIDEYHGDWETEDQKVLVVSGAIESGSACTFILRKSTPIKITSDQGVSSITSSYVGTENVRAQENYEKGATVSVESESGKVYRCLEYYEGHYVAYLDDLDSEEKYFLRMILSDGEEYTTTPSKPLDSPEITSAGWKKEGLDVQLNITTGEIKEEAYLSWEYCDIWEVRTPFEAHYEYNPETGEIEKVPRGKAKNRGWIEKSQHSRIVGDNKNYGNGALKQYPLYYIDKDDPRFQVKYYTKIKQYALSREEYEYNNLILLYNSQMGGLFTPMPSELPTNIRSTKGKKGVGYIGVRGKVSSAEVCIGKDQVGCEYYVPGEVIPDSWTKGLWYSVLYDLGYRVYQYSIADGATWTYPYCVDVTYLGASLEKPYFWDDLEFTPEDAN